MAETKSTAARPREPEPPEPPRSAPQASGVVIPFRRPTKAVARVPFRPIQLRRAA